MERACVTDAGAQHRMTELSAGSWYRRLGRPRMNYLVWLNVNTTYRTWRSQQAKLVVDRSKWRRWVAWRVFHADLT